MTTIHNQRHLTLSDRVFIEQGLLQKHSFRDIALALEKDPTTIAKEVKRNYRTYHESLFIPTCRKCTEFHDCKRKHVCGSSSCNRSCRYCMANRNCPHFDRIPCRLDKPPYVCNVCPWLKKCSQPQHIYEAAWAQRKYEKTISESRKGIDLSLDELQALNDIVSPLILQGQPLSHIFATHADEIPVSRRTLYNYLDQRVFQARNIDLPRRVRYKKRKRGRISHRENQQAYRNNRTYRDFERFMEAHPEEEEVVEMDTVKGSNKRGKCLLTLLFRRSNFMLVFLLPSCTQKAVINALNDFEDRISHRTFRKYLHIFLTDNGSEFKDRWGLETDCNGRHRSYVFYCDPRSANQKGKLEKNHEFIRYVIPKGRSMQKLTQADISLMASHINSLSRDILNGKTPFDLADLLLDKKIPVAADIHRISPDSVMLKPALIFHGPDPSDKGI